MIDYRPFLDHLANTELKCWVASLEAQLTKQWRELKDGNVPQLVAYLAQLPNAKLEQLAVESAIRLEGAVTDKAALLSVLKALRPWRKGPFNFFGIAIDAEWRCDLKWQRLNNQLPSLAGQHILDVGAGNGYFGWQMKAAGAATVVGIDPSWLSVAQHQASNHYIKDASHTVLPLTLEQLTPNLQLFDTVFSMGVLYHRRSPLDHLFELRGALKPGGQLVLETLVIEGDCGATLVPVGRYARMNNVWFLPSVATLVRWLERMGFANIRVIDQTRTTTAEQRRTEWKPGHSLSDYLDPADASRTIEGYPAPLRAILFATKPVQQRLQRYMEDID